MSKRCPVCGAEIMAGQERCLNCGGKSVGGCMSVLADATEYFDFDSDMFREIYELIAVKHFPVRIPPDKWPDQKLIGKAMVKGWAVPCRYYPRPWRRSGYCMSFVYPGISDYEMELVHQIMRGRMNDA